MLWWEKLKLSNYGAIRLCQKLKIIMWYDGLLEEWKKCLKRLRNRLASITILAGWDRRVLWPKQKWQKSWEIKSGFSLLRNFTHVNGREFKTGSRVWYLASAERVEPHSTFPVDASRPCIFYFISYFVSCRTRILIRVLRPINCNARLTNFRKASASSSGTEKAKHLR